MNNRLPWGIEQACAGIVADCRTEPYRRAIQAAEGVVGQDYVDTPQAQANREQLVKMVKANLVNRKSGSRDSLNRKYGMCISERRLREEKRRFCYELARQTHLIDADTGCSNENHKDRRQCGSPKLTSFMEEDSGDTPCM